MPREYKHQRNPRSAQAQKKVEKAYATLRAKRDEAVAAEQRLLDALADTFATADRNAAIRDRLRSEIARNTRRER